MITLLTNNWTLLLTGLATTLLCSVIALVFSLLLGTLNALMQLSQLKLLRIVGNIYVEIFRNLPLLIITMSFYVVLPKILPLKLSGFTAGTIGLVFYTSAFVAEIVRAGILSLGKGQLEGALACGMTYAQAMRHVILPQAFKVMIPSLGNQFINMIKNSSILAFVAGADLMYQGQIVANTTYQTTQSYLWVGGFYLCLTLPISYLMRHLENKLASN